MADTKISALTDGTTANGTDKVPVERAGGNRYITPAYISTYIDGLAHTFTAAAPQLTLGVNATTLGSIKMFGNTSGDVTLRPTAAAGTATTITLPATTTTLAGLAVAQTFTAQNTFAAGTLTADTPASWTQTWNNAGVTFTALKLDVTNTASAAASLLLDLEVGGVTQFSVRRDGRVLTPLVGSDYSLTASIFFSGSNAIHYISGGEVFRSVSSGVNIAQSNALMWNTDTYIYRDGAANTIAQRNSTTAQTFRVYRTFTDSSNYQRLSATWNTSTLLLMNEGAGTGADGNIAFNDAALATTATRGYLMIPSCAGAPTGVPADIPTGQVALHFDTTNNKLYVYDGGWLSTAALT